MGAGFGKNEPVWEALHAGCFTRGERAIRHRVDEHGAAFLRHAQFDTAFDLGVNSIARAAGFTAELARLEVDGGEEASRLREELCS